MGNEHNQPKPEPEVTPKTPEPEMPPLRDPRPEINTPIPPPDPEPGQPGEPVADDTPPATRSRNV